MQKLIDTAPWMWSDRVFIVLLTIQRLVCYYQWSGQEVPPALSNTKEKRRRFWRWKWSLLGTTQYILKSWKIIYATHYFKTTISLLVMDRTTASVTALQQHKNSQQQKLLFVILYFKELSYCNICIPGDFCVTFVEFSCQGFKFTDQR